MRTLRAMVALALACAIFVPFAGPVPASAAPNRPNILLIISDDQAWSNFSRRLMPTVFGDIADRGALFTRAYASSSVCCPSRAEMFTGLYEHHTNVDSNMVPLLRPTVAMALHDAGYRTMMAGKYLNSWASCAPRPEFDRWSCVGTPDPSTYSQVDPWINVDGRMTHFAGYQTDILAAQVSSFVANTSADRPFFAIYAPTSPHSPADDPRYADMAVTVPRPPNWNVETRTAANPEFVRKHPMSTGLIASTDHHYRKAAYSVRALDDAVGTLLDGLGDRADDTLVLYVSDNGYAFGTHRRVGKDDAYEEAARIPMAVRYPAALPPGAAFTSSRLVANYDVAPTIADAAGLPWAADGASILPLVRGDPDPIHDAVLLERCHGDHLVADPCSGFEFEGENIYPPTFDGVVTERYKYVEYATGDRQLFDLEADPYELANLAGVAGSSAVRDQMAARLQALRLPPPVDTTIVSGPQGVLPRRVAEFTFFSPSLFATYRCRLTAGGGTPGDWHHCSGGTDVLGGLTDGDYVFEVAGKDETGALDPSPATRAFKVVTASGPQVSILEGPPPSQRTSEATFQYTSTTPGVRFACRMALWGTTGVWKRCDPDDGATYAGLGEGLWRFDVRAVDPVSGAVSAPPDTRLTRVDTKGPTFVVSSRPPRVTSATTAAFAFAPLEATTGPWTCGLDAAPATDCSGGSAQFAGIAGGTHTLRISAEDLLGNTQTTTITWVVDRTLPTVRIASGPSSTTSSNTATFVFTSNEDPSTFACVVDALPEMPCSATWKIPSLSNGPHTLSVRAIDRALNRSVAVRRSWVVDRS